MNKVLIYSTNTCVFCKKAKEVVKEHKVEFTEIDVGKDIKAAKEMVAKSGQMGVPVIEVNGKIVVGFDKPALMKELKIK